MSGTGKLKIDDPTWEPGSTLQKVKWITNQMVSRTVNIDETKGKGLNLENSCGQKKFFHLLAQLSPNDIVTSLLTCCWKLVYIPIPGNFMDTLFSLMSTSSDQVLDSTMESSSMNRGTKSLIWKKKRTNNE